MFGVSFGLASSNTATLPATIGAETEVPLRRMTPLPLFDAAPHAETHRSRFSPSSLLCGEAAGGANNAYTDQDVTVYQDWFPSTALELIFDLESDRIENLSFDPKMIQSEREVVASLHPVNVIGQRNVRAKKVSVRVVTHAEITRHAD